jgi:hypothetical protein
MGEEFTVEKFWGGPSRLSRFRSELRFGCSSCTFSVSANKYRKMLVNCFDCYRPTPCVIAQRMMLNHMMMMRG